MPNHNDPLELIIPEDLKQALAERERELARLKARLDELEQQEEARLSQQVRLEKELSSLSNLLVATYRLHESVERQDVLQAIQEIITAIVGSEEAAIFELSPEGKALTLVASMGIESGQLRRIPIGEGTIGKTALSGDLHVFASPKEDGPKYELGLTACVPLKVGGHAIGAIAIFRLLPQKQGLDHRDRELFELLASQAAIALQHSRLRAEVGP